MAEGFRHPQPHLLGLAGTPSAAASGFRSPWPLLIGLAGNVAGGRFDHDVLDGRHPLRRPLDDEDDDLMAAMMMMTVTMRRH